MIYCPFVSKSVEMCLIAQTHYFIFYTKKINTNLRKVARAFRIKIIKVKSTES